jgi:hypothetical protein
VYKRKEKRKNGRMRKKNEKNLFLSKKSVFVEI